MKKITIGQVFLFVFTLVTAILALAVGSVYIVPFCYVWVGFLLWVSGGFQSSFLRTICLWYPAILLGKREWLP